MLLINLKYSHVIRLGCIFCLWSFSAMPRNVEIKARLPNPVKSSEVARELSGTEGKSYRWVACTHAQIGLIHVHASLLGSLLVQEDTFFNVPQGRLKVGNLT